MYTKEMAAVAIERIYTAKSLKDAVGGTARELRTFFELVASDPNLSRDYALAQQARAELMADELVDIADNEIDSQKARNRIDVRKWYASKMKPEKFGERIDLNVNHVVDLTAALTEAKKRLLPGVNSDDIIDAEHHVIADESPNDATGSKPVNAETQDATNSASSDIFD